MVVTNVPYLARGKQSDILRDYCEKHYAEGKNDLSTVFLDRCLELCRKNGTSSIVLPQNWLFLTRYKRFREKLLKNNTLHLIALLGPNAFETISGEVVKVILVTISRGNAIERDAPLPTYIERSKIGGVNVTEMATAVDKAALLPTIQINQIEQAKQLRNPDARIMFFESYCGSLLSAYAETGTGMQTYDNPRFFIEFWEISRIANGWKYLQSTPSQKALFSGMSGAVRWQDGKGDLLNYMKDKETFEGYTSGIWKAGSQFWGKKGIIHGLMSDLPHSRYLGYPYDVNVAVVIPKNEDDILALWAYSDSKEFSKEVRKIDQSLKVTNATIVKSSFRHRSLDRNRREKNIPGTAQAIF